MEEDTVSLPHQQSFSSLKTDSDYIYQVPSIHLPPYDSQLLRPSMSRPRRATTTTTHTQHRPMSPSDPRVALYGTPSLLQHRRVASDLPLARRAARTRGDGASSSPSHSAGEKSGSETESLRGMHPNKRFYAADDKSSNTLPKFVRSSEQSGSDTESLRKQRSSLVLSSPEHSSSEAESLRQQLSRKSAAGQTTVRVSPPLETSLHVILDRGTRETTRNPRREQEMRNFIDFSPERARTAGGDSDSDSCLSFNVDNNKKREGSGLSDYLKTLSSPKKQPPNDSNPP